MMGKPVKGFLDRLTLADLQRRNLNKSEIKLSDFPSATLRGGDGRTPRATVFKIMLKEASLSENWSRRLWYRHALCLSMQLSMLYSYVPDDSRQELLRFILLRLLT